MAAIVNATMQLGTAAKDRSMQMINNNVVSPRRRSELYYNLRSWITVHPMLASFIFAHLAVSGMPVAIFLSFSTTVLLSSLATCLTIAIITALSFTAMCVGGALFIFVPTILVTGFIATSLWISGYVTLYLLTWANKIRATAPSARDVERSLKSSIRELEKDTVALEQSVSNKANQFINSAKSTYDNVSSQAKSTYDNVSNQVNQTASTVKNDVLASTQQPAVAGQTSSGVHVDDSQMKDKWTNYLDQAERTAKPQTGVTSKTGQSLDQSVNAQLKSVQNNQFSSNGGNSPVQDHYRLTTQDNKENLTDVLGNGGSLGSANGFHDGPPALNFAGSAHAYRSS